jgi:predicted GNAT family acetyltransferase
MVAKDYSKLLAGSPYKLAPEPPQQHLVLAYSSTGHGKTTFALDSPDPIAYNDIDLRALHAIKRAREEKGKVVFHNSVQSVRKASSLTEEQVKAAGRKSFDQFVKAVEWACVQKEKGNVQTLVQDTGSELYQLNMFAVFGRTDKIMKRDHGIPRHEFRSLTKMIRQSGLNLVMLCHQKEEYRNDAPTGKMTWAGFEDMGADVDTAVRLEMVNKKFPGESEKRTRFEMTVVKAGINALTFNQTYTSDDWEGVGLGPFTYLALQTFPESTLDDWGAEVSE